MEIFFISICVILFLVFLSSIIIINLKYKKATMERDEPKLPELEYREKSTGEKCLYIHIPNEFGSVTIQTNKQRLALIEFLVNEKTQKYFLPKKPIDII